MFPVFLVLKVEILNYESGRSGRAAPCRKYFEKTYENEKDVVNQENILCQVQVAGKNDIPVPTNLTVGGFIVFSDKLLRNTESEIEFSRRAFPQYLVYFELRNIHTNYALWIVTTHLLKTLNN